MDEDRTVGPLRDELGLAIERALAIDPAPGLKARVRARIERERTRNTWSLRWGLAGAASLAAAVVLLVVVTTSQRESAPVADTRIPESVPSVAAPVEDSASLPQPTVTAPPTRPAGGRARVASIALTTDREVLIPPGEAAALRALMTGIREGRIDSSMFDEIDAGPLAPPVAIVIEPIAIEPLAALGLMEGVRP